MIQFDWMELLILVMQKHKLSEVTITQADFMEFKGRDITVAITNAVEEHALTVVLLDSKKLKEAEAKQAAQAAMDAILKAKAGEPAGPDPA